jgi:hypothetical protein
LRYRAFRDDLRFFCHPIKCLYASKIQPMALTEAVRALAIRDAVAAVYDRRSSRVGGHRPPLQSRRRVRSFKTVPN